MSIKNNNPKNLRQHQRQRQRQLQQGIGLIEIIAAMGLATTVIVAVATLALKTLKSSVDSRMQLQVTKISNRELENVRAIREIATSWQNGADGFLDKVGACIRVGGSTTEKCSVNPADLTVSASPVTEGSGVDAITRYFYITYPTSSNTKLVRINVEISYLSGSVTKLVHTYTEFTDWKSSQ